MCDNSQILKKIEEKICTTSIECVKSIKGKHKVNIYSTFDRQKTGEITFKGIDSPFFNKGAEEDEHFGMLFLDKLLYKA